MRYRIVFFVLLVILCSRGYAQEILFNSQTDEIAKEEQKRNRSLHFDTPQYQKSPIALKWINAHFWVNPSEHYIKGQVLIRFEPLELTDSLVLDLSDSLQIDSVIFHGNNLTVEHSNYRVKVQFPQNIVPANLDSIEVHYHGAPPLLNNRGLITTERADGTPMLYTLSEPYYAKEWWPVIQDLGERLDSIVVQITCPSNYYGVSNGLLSSVTESGGLKTYRWEHHYSIPPYLVAIAVSDYLVIEDSIQLEQGTLPFINYIYPSQQNEVELFQQLKPMLQLYENIADQYPYMSEKYGHCMWEINGGMEHTTVSFMGNFGWELQAHELAHMWFGDLVTCASWKDIWLNEGFATYYTGLTYEFLPGVRQYWSRWKRIQVEKITSETGGAVYVEDTTDVSRIFDSRLSYSKGAFVLHMLRWHTDTLHFFDNVNAWLNAEDYRFGFGTTEDFRHLMENESGIDLEEFFNDWVYGEGYPSFTVEWEQKGNALTVELNQTTSHSSVDFFEVKLPLRVYNRSGDSLDLTAMHNYNGERFEYQVPFVVDSLAVDPDLWLISRGNKVINKKERQVVKVYPNPATEVLNVHSNDPDGVIYKITLMDVKGKVIRRVEGISYQHYTIDLNGFQSGQYVLVVDTKWGNKIFNVVIVE